MIGLQVRLAPVSARTDFLYQFHQGSADYQSVLQFLDLIQRLLLQVLLDLELLRYEIIKRC